mmetsp:Transcript_10487/g.21789  ORF Transcript_10487/g.21789 Transcript_10487/m.21789 type:complete len:81 (+) Transcript_10487:852-1094(+)
MHHHKTNYSHGATTTITTSKANPTNRYNEIAIIQSMKRACNRQYPRTILGNGPSQNGWQCDRFRGKAEVEEGAVVGAFFG